MQLCAVLDSKGAPDDPIEAVGRASVRWRTRPSAALILALAVIVLTMTTQAFSLEATHLLKGYWGTNR